jgi:hypothetical protein
LGNHPKNNFDKFGYISRYESRKKPGSFYLLGYLLELITKIWQFGFFSLQNLANLAFFSLKNLSKVEIIFFRLKFGENLPAKEMLLLRVSWSMSHYF